MRLTTGLALVVLDLSIASNYAFSDAVSTQPCAEIAGYLSDFAERNPELTRDTGRAEFLKAAINLSYERVESKGLPIEALQPRKFDTALQAIQSLGEPIAEPNLKERLQRGDLSGRDLYDARRFGGFVALNDVQGTMQCSYGFLMTSEQDGLHLGPVLENEGGQICWVSSFEVIKVGARAYPAVVSRDVYFNSLTYRIIVLPTDAGPMNVNRPRCTIAVSYSPRFNVAEWFVAAELNDATSTQLKSELEPILKDLAASKDKGRGSNDALVWENGQRPSIIGRVPFAGEHNNPYTQLDGTYSKLTLNGKEYVLGYGEALFGWRTWIDHAFGVWVKDGSRLVPVAGGFMGKQGTAPRISAGAN